MGVPKTSDHIQIKIRMQNPSQEPPGSSKAPNEDLKDMNVPCTFKIKIECQNLDHWYIKNQWPYLNQDQDAKPQLGTSSVLQSPKWGLKGHGCSLHLQNQDRESWDLFTGLHSLYRLWLPLLGLALIFAYPRSENILFLGQVLCWMGGLAGVSQVGELAKTNQY